MATKAFMGITIDRHISIGHIFTTIIAIGAGFSAYFNIQYRIADLEKADVRMEKTISEQKSEHKSTLDRIYLQLEKINDKLDKKMDR